LATLGAVIAKMRKRILNERKTEANMAGRKLKVSLSQIAKEIAKAEKELKKLEKRVSAADKKKIKLEIKSLGKFNRWLRGSCKAGRMTQVFLAKMTYGCHK
jgi:septal ring factor EnvC (AmiA/AmiB activator)